MLNALDEKVGKGNYTLFLTADHGTSEVAQYLIDMKVPAGYIDYKMLNKQARQFMNNLYGNGKWIDTLMNDQFYFNKSLMIESKINIIEAQNQLATFLKDRQEIAHVYTAQQLDQQEYTQYISMMVQNGFYYKRSGDVDFVTESGWVEKSNNASNHKHWPCL